MIPVLLTKNSSGKKQSYFDLSSQGRQLAKLVYNHNGFADEVKFSDGSKMYLKMHEKGVGKLGYKRKFLTPADLSRYFDLTEKRVVLGESRFLQNNNVILYNQELTFKYDVNKGLRKLLKPRLYASASYRGYKNIDFDLVGGIVKARINRGCYLNYSKRCQLIVDSKQEIENNLQQRFGDKLYRVNLAGNISWELNNNTLKASFGYYYEKKKEIERFFDLSQRIKAAFIAKYGRKQWSRKDYMSDTLNDSNVIYTMYERKFFVKNIKLGQIKIALDTYEQPLTNSFNIISKIKSYTDDRGLLRLSFNIPDREYNKFSSFI